MAVTLDAPGDPPMWKVPCEGGCGARLYIAAETAGEAAERATIYGWAYVAISAICRTCLRGPR